MTLSERVDGRDHFVLPMNPTGLDRILDGACRTVDALETDTDLTPYMRSSIERLRTGLSQYRAEQQHDAEG